MHVPASLESAAVIDFDTSHTVVNEQAGRTINVVHLATRLTLAGVGNVVASLLRGMPAQSYRSSVWCLEEADVVGEDLRAEGHYLVELRKRHRRDIVLFFRLATLIRKEHVDILHCHDELSWFYGAIGARLAGMERILFTVHGRRFDTSRRHCWEQSVLGRLSTAVVCVSSSLRRQMIDEIGIPDVKAIVIRNGAPMEALTSQISQRQRVRQALRIPESAILIGSIGRLDPVKNLDLLLEASAAAARIIPSLKILLAGEGPSKQELIEKTAELAIENRVSFLGLRKDVSDLLSAIDLYVCSSDREGISLSILEAMAAERAIIATAVGGNLELVQHDRTGLLIDRGDHEALVQAIITLSKNSRKRVELGREARRFVQANFSVNRMLHDYDCLYQSLTRSRSIDAT